jgi:hypothetical protein
MKTIITLTSEKQACILGKDPIRNNNNKERTLYGVSFY